MDKERVAEILVEIGTLLELKGENPFKTRAYLNGARIIEGLNESLKKLVEEERLVKGSVRSIYTNPSSAFAQPGLIDILEKGCTWVCSG